jgi:hypothetical protein
MSDNYREIQTFNPLQKTVKYYFTSNLSKSKIFIKLGIKFRVKVVCRMITERYTPL